MEALLEMAGVALIGVGAEGVIGVDAAGVGACAGVAVCFGSGAGAEAEVVKAADGCDCTAEVVPLERSTTLRLMSLPAKKSVAVRAGSKEGAAGKISDWKESDLRGTMKAKGSTVVPDTLYARAISHSETFKDLRGKKHMPRWGSVDLYSARE